MRTDLSKPNAALARGVRLSSFRLRFARVGHASAIHHWNGGGGRRGGSVGRGAFTIYDDDGKTYAY